MSEVKETVPKTKPTGSSVEVVGFVFVLVVVVEVLVMVEVVDKVEVVLTVVVETVLVVVVDVVVVNIHPMSKGLVPLCAGQSFAPSMQTPVANSPQDSPKSSDETGVATAMPVCVLQCKVMYCDVRFCVHCMVLYGMSYHAMSCHVMSCCVVM